MKKELPIFGVLSSLLLFLRKIKYFPVVVSLDDHFFLQELELLKPAIYTTPKHGS